MGNAGSMGDFCGRKDVRFPSFIKYGAATEAFDAFINDAHGLEASKKLGENIMLEKDAEMWKNVGIIRTDANKMSNAIATILKNWQDGDQTDISKFYQEVFDVKPGDVAKVNYSLATLPAQHRRKTGLQKIGNCGNKNNFKALFYIAWLHMMADVRVRGKVDTEKMRNKAHQIYELGALRSKVRAWNFLVSQEKSWNQAQKNDFREKKLQGKHARIRAKKILENAQKFSDTKIWTRI